MPASSPYLQHRGHALAFRIAVPPDLRAAFGCREVVHALPADSLTLARDYALILGLRVRQLFVSARRERRLSELCRSRLTALLGEVRPTAPAADVRVEVDALPSLPDPSRRALGVTRHPPANVVPTPRLQLSAVITSFLKAYPTRHDAMRRKHVTCLPVFLELVGDRPIDTLKHAQVRDAFDVLQRLPPHWKALKRQRGFSLRDIAAVDHPACLGEKTFRDTYLASIRQFLVWAYESFGDQGFPSLPLKTIQYTGARAAGIHGQRALTEGELKRLFEGPEMRSMAADPIDSFRCWLPMLGLYTGARVNELCQLNPQTDIRQEPESGIWYLDITNEGEAADGVTKHVKNKVSKRRVPVHSALLKAGFIDYVEALRRQLAKRLFPQWRVARERATGEADRWFRLFVEHVGLRDETLGARVVGMHAFRSTFSRRAFLLGIDESPLVGHQTPNQTDVQAGYRGQRPLSQLQALMEAITFDVRLPQPCLPVPVDLLSSSSR